MTKEETAYADALNLYGSDPEDASEHEILHHMNFAAHPEKIVLTSSVNFPATLAAVRARGPRCERCASWTFRPEYLDLPRFVARLCPACLPLRTELRDPWIKSISLSQVFRSELDRYAPGEVIEL